MIRVIVTDEEIRCERPGLVESVRWDRLRAVLIETNDLGPLLDDVFWILIDSEGGCVVPMGADGEQDMLRALQERLPDFDNEMVIAAMQSVDNARFLCWERGGQHPAT